MSHFLIVAAGGAFGAGLRHLVGLAALRLVGPGFPWATFMVNVVGSLLMGALIAYLAKRAGIAPEWRLFLATGFLGGFTTFSAFSMETVLLWERGEAMAAGFYVFGSVFFSILAFMTGLMVVRALSG